MIPVDGGITSCGSRGQGCPYQAHDYSIARFISEDIVDLQPTTAGNTMPPSEPDTIQAYTTSMKEHLAAFDAAFYQKEAAHKTPSASSSGTRYQDEEGE